MKKIVGVSANWMWVVPAFFFLVIASVGVVEAQKKSTTSGSEKPETLLMSAMKNMSTGVWSVNGTVTLEKTIKLHRLLSG